MSAKNHIHKLRRHKYKTGVSVYFCTMEDCHFKIECALSLGKRAICNLCNNEFVMNEYTIKLARPHCPDCSKQKVQGEDGKNYYVRKTSLPITNDIAKGNLDELRSRLSGTVAIIDRSSDDI